MKLVLSIFLLVLISCSSNSTMERALVDFISNPVTLPSNLEPLRKDADSTIYGHHDSELKCVVYTESRSCNSCALRGLFLWSDLIEYANKYDGALKFYFIFNPPKGENIRLALRNSVLDYPMLLDSLGEFERLNPHLPKNKAMHTFLLDEDNNVVLVGNPLHNPKIERMFKEIVEKKLGKKE